MLPCLLVMLLTQIRQKRRQSTGEIKRREMSWTLTKELAQKRSDIRSREVVLG